MKLEFSNLNKDGRAGIHSQDGLLIFFCIRPIVIQPAEIQRVQIGVGLKIPKGYILNISTHPELCERAGEVFPALITLNHLQKGELVLAVRNNGRNPLHLMPDALVAQGYAVRIEELDEQEVDAGIVLPEPPSKTKPQKKKDPFNFEVK